MPELLARAARIRVPLGFLAGAFALWLSHPTARSLALGTAVALLGEAVRIWAAGHVEKGREVTTSGPYRWMRHPLYVGSSIIGLGVAVASASPVVIALVGLYLVGTLTPAIRTEEAWLRHAFGQAYDQYCVGQITETRRVFSWSRVLRNREHRALAGLVAGIALLALKTAFGV